MQRLKTIGLLLFLAVSIRLNAEDTSSPVSYRLKGTIEPDAGSIAVQGSIDVPLQDSGGTYGSPRSHGDRIWRPNEAASGI
jgi:hypothetical protein